MTKQPNEETVAATPAPRRSFCPAYTRALARKANPPKPKRWVKIRCKTFDGGLRALLRAFGEQVWALNFKHDIFGAGTNWLSPTMAVSTIVKSKAQTAHPWVG
jgi:hypothetical protein